MRGHAIEARLYAEDPATGFLPSIGPLAIFDLGAFAAPRAGAALRLDSAVEEGDAVRPHYDPMIAKAIAHAPTREAAAQELAYALSQVRIWPVRTNAGFLARTLSDPDFRAAKVDTGFIEARLDALTGGIDPSEAAALGALVEAFRLRLAGQEDADPWSAGDAWRLNAPARCSSAFEIGGRRWDAVVAGAELTPRVEVDGVERAVALQSIAVTASQGQLELTLEGRPTLASFVAMPDGLVLFVNGEAVMLSPPRPGAHAAALEAGDDIAAPMPGRVLEVRAAPGDALAAGDTVLVLEAMKMEHALAAPRAGVLADVLVGAGDQVALGMVLARLEPAGEGG
jgi:acetyl/propionyl-CoA carboxylase alpha subunit